MTASLTEAIIALGWQPPAIRTKWDLLPLVTVAEGDEPWITPIHDNPFPLVNISHPNATHALAFKKLGLRWVPAPALSNLGFDLGGLQFTAAPFIGWFMDAEIGVRDLADSFRYDCLPSVITALRLCEPDQDVEELPQSEKLLMLSQAQAELNYAVHWSFAQAGVRMSDTLSAATMYTNFDDQHLATHGFRLPADPYWIAPPQGSIVPLWHRGSAPNYQPKPMICRQSRCPMTAWKRLKAAKTRRLTPQDDDASLMPPSKMSKAGSNGTSEPVLPTVHIVYCSSGVTAPRLAEKLKTSLLSLMQSGTGFSTRIVAMPLNNLNWNSLKAEDVVLVIASSAGRGDIPTNGLTAMRNLTSNKGFHGEGIQFSIFGNGNSSYGENFNGAAHKLQTAMETAGFQTALPMFKGDTLKEDPPWRQFNGWMSLLSNHFGFSADADEEVDDGSSASDSSQDLSAFAEFLEQFSQASVVDVINHTQKSMSIVSLNLGSLRYEQMQHIDVMVPLAAAETSDLLSSLGLNGEETFTVGGKAWTSRQLLSFVDIEKPFGSFMWARKAGVPLKASTVFSIANAPVRQAIKALMNLEGSKVDFLSLISNMPFRGPRTFSVASAPQRHKRHILDLLVQTRKGGLFTERFIGQAKPGDKLSVRMRSGPGTSLGTDDIPVVAFVTGSGMAPLRGLLQRRVADASNAAKGRVGASPPTPSRGRSGITVFAGFKPVDKDIINSCMGDAKKVGIIDTLCLLPSNAEKKRVQDEIFQKEYRNKVRSKILDDGASVFVCASKEAADDFARNLGAIVGVSSIRDVLGDKWVEEVYVSAKA